MTDKAPKKDLDHSLDLKSWSASAIGASTFICQYGKKSTLVGKEVSYTKATCPFWIRELDFERSEDIEGVHFITC